MAESKIVKTLKSIFNITDVKSSNNTNQNKKQVHPAYMDKKAGKLRPVKFGDDLQKLYNYWLNDSFESTDSLKNRKDRIAALSYAYYNSSIFSKAVNLYADETIQADENNEIIKVDAKNKKVIKYIYEFLNNVGASSEDNLFDVAFNISLFGDSFWIISIDYDNKEITDITPIEVLDIKDRIEFNASQVAKKKREQKNLKQIKKDTKLQSIYDMLQDTIDKKDYGNYYKSYLFGFWMGDNNYLAPWNVLHFRHFTTFSEFFPFGRPVMINCLAPFRQLQAGKNLMALARANNFPIKIFEIETNENMSEDEKWEVVNGAREEYHNLGYDVSENEQFAAGSEVWVPSGLINYKQEDSRLNLDDIADIEMLRDDLIMGTDIPKGYLIVDRASFGTSGQSLLRQHKPFARATYKVQSTILKQLIQLIRLQFAISGDFDYDEPFELSMNFPEIEESSDRLRMKNDMLRLAKDVIDNIGEVIGLDRGESLPPEVAKEVLSQISFLDTDDVEKWIDSAVEDKESEEEMNLENNNKNKKKIIEKIKNSLDEEIVKKCYFDAKKRTGLLESTSSNRHFYSSYKIDNYEKLILEKINKERIEKRLQEYEE